MTRNFAFISVALLVAGSSSVVAQAKTSHSKLKYAAAPAALPAGAEMAVVSGDPGGKGMFSVNLKMPANYVIPPHTHPTTEKVTVLSGKLGYGMNDKLDTAHAKTMASGHHLMMTAKMTHWVMAKGPTVIQVSGKAPFAITYADPKDDPRNK